MSDTDPLMTSSTSAVAVWRSSASFVSLNSLAFWIAITAWSAKVCSSATSSSAKGCGGLRTKISVPITPPCHRSGRYTWAQSPKSIAAMISRSIGGTSAPCSTLS